MNQMVAMVTEKKVSGRRQTWTRTAVREKSRKMKIMLAATRTRCFTLRRRDGAENTAGLSCPRRPSAAGRVNITAGTTGRGRSWPA